MSRTYTQGILFDGYVDEPTALGVPPYVAPYPRYVAGAFRERDVPVRYLTVDGWRRDEALRDLVREAGPETLLVVVSGLTVPGHYRGGTPLTMAELEGLVYQTGATAVVGGPLQHGYTLTGGTSARGVVLPGGARLVQGDLDATVADLLAGEEEPNARRRSYEELAPRAVLGADVVRQHPRFPHVIAELETARGCERRQHCSFCTEGLWEGRDYRTEEAILGEVEALHAAGLRHFRLGKQPNFFAWPGRQGLDGSAVPDPEAIAGLYRGLRSAAPQLKTLHLDNVNPGFVAQHAEACGAIARTIAEYNTAGDVAAMGLESLDPEVVRLNGLKCSPEEALRAIEIVVRNGGVREPGSLPKLLPGLNLLFGLPGESAATYELNYAFLEALLDAGLPVRRINLRQVMVFPGTPLYRVTGGAGPKLNKGRFKRFKRRVQEQIEQPMLRLVAPLGTVLPGVVSEFRDGDVTFGRQLASYPLLVGTPYPLPLLEARDMVVVGHGFRSVTALPLPIAVNSVPLKGLAAIPGIGRKRARRLVEARPLSSMAAISEALDDPTVVADWLPFMAL